MGFFKEFGKILGVGDKETKTSGTRKGTTTVTKQLDISQEGLDKIVADILGGEQGLAEVFSEENIAGIFDTTVGAQAAGDLITNLAGELAKLTAKEVVTEEEDIRTTGKEVAPGGGLLGALGQVAGIAGKLK